MLKTNMESQDDYLTFMATREPGVREEHLHRPEMRELPWERQYKSLLRGDDLAAYRRLLEQPWVRVAEARTTADVWDSYWLAKRAMPGAPGARAGTIIFTRSWSAQILAEVDVHFSPDYVTMFTDRIRVTLEATYDDEFDKRMANWLLMTKFWSIPFYPFPHDPSVGDITSMEAGRAAFLLGGKGTMIISDADPDITDTYSIVRLINEKIHVPYVSLLLHVIQS
jgi:hypothetical protein